MQDTLFALVVIVLFLGIYFLPLAVAGSKNHPHCTGIGLLNLFLGWTFIGWVGALIWANVVPRQPVVVNQ